MDVTLYWPETGEIEVKAPTAVSGSHMLSAYTDEGMGWVQVSTDPALHYMPGGVKTDRPVLLAMPASAPLEVDCSATGGDVVFRNEAGDEVAEAGMMTLEDPGEYTIIPPHPWREQTVTLT